MSLSVKLFEYAEPETDDHEMEVSEDPEIDALFK